MRKYVAALVLAVISFSSPVISIRVPNFVPRNVVRYQIQLPQNLTTVEYRRLQKWLVDNRFDVAGVNLRLRTIEVITNDFGIQNLTSHGITGKVVSSRTDATPDKRFLNPSTVSEKLKSLSTAHPQHSKVIELGKSRQGRSVFALLVSSTPDMDSAAYFAKPSIVIDALHHAREVMTPEIAMDFAENILNQKNSPAGQKFLQDWNVWVVPMVNPDGSNIVWTTDNMWRKNAYAQEQRIFGVDNNRNYEFLWNACRGSSGDPGDGAYRGPQAKSEPETQSMVKLGEFARPAIYLSYHSYGELIIYPYGCENKDAPELKLHQKLGQYLSTQLKSDSGRGNYQYGRSFEILYATDGTSLDFMHGAFGALSFVVEVNEQFQPSYDLRAPTVIKQRTALLNLMEVSRQNLFRLRVIDSKQTPVGKARIELSNIRRQMEAPLVTNAAGYFFKVMGEVGFQAKVTLPDGRSQVITVDKLDSLVTVSF